MDEPYDARRSALPPSKFGAGYTVGEGAAEPPPAYGYPSAYPPPSAEPPPLGGEPVRYPPSPVAYPVTPVPGVYVPATKTNSMAIAALVCSLVLAPLGIVFGHIALSQMKRTGEDGRGLAIAGLVIGYIFTGIALLWIIVVIVFFGALGSALTDSNYYDSGYSYSMAKTAVSAAIFR